MRASLARLISEDGVSPARRRSLSLLLTIIAHALLLWMLLRLAPEQFAPMRRAAGALMTFAVQPSPEPTPQRARQEQKQAAAQPAASRAAAAPPIPPPVVKLPTAPAKPYEVMELSRDDMATLDATMSHRVYGPPAPGSESARGGGDDTPSTAGPNGERLYAAEWYREPTQAEIGPYLPHSATPGTWGEIACRTVARFHVEDCRELGDSLPGVGIARAMRQAAFQFLVRPPRVGGQSLTGTWVRIRITITRKGEGDPDER